ncbi:MAG: addiction module antidote protein, HigA family [Bacteroidetes bacterium]|nr:MAG: addiction module antidote protein, HigA family [Bacteroidota bacterium]
MMNKKITEPENGLLTNQMDVNSTDFDKFQAKLLNKSRARTQEQNLNIELLALKYKIEDYLNNDNNEDVKIAGEFIKQYLRTLRIKQNRFAEYIGIKPSNLSKLLKGERPINYELALILGRIFKVNPMIWIEIQAKNELLRLKQVKHQELFKYSLKDLLRMDNNGV